MTVAKRFDSSKLGATLLAACAVALGCSSSESEPTPGGTAGTGAQQGGSSANVAGSAGATATGGAASGGGGGGSPAAGQAGSSSAGTTASGGGGAAGQGGGGAGGGGADSGGSGGSGPADVTPVATAKGYSFTFGDIVLEIDNQVGGRVGKLSLGGADLIMTAATDPTTWGSVFWTSPRMDWTPMTWPPPAALDNAAYTARVSGTHVVTEGPVDPGLGVSMSKDYSVDPATGYINITYTVKATKALKAAPWEVSRVPRGGIVFFPVGAALTAGPLTVKQSNGIAWFDDAPKTATSPNGDKCFADGAGWTAYVVNGNLFLKKFMDQPLSAQPEDEGEIDIYPGDGFLEFEVQGPYTDIAANGSLPWSIQWKVVKVPSSIEVKVENAALVGFAKQQLGL